MNEKNTEQKEKRYTVDNPRYKKGLRYEAPMDYGEFSDGALWEMNRDQFTSQAITELLDKRKKETNQAAPEVPISVFGKLGRFLRGKRAGDAFEDTIPTEGELQDSGPVLLGADLYKDPAMQSLYEEKRALFPNRNYRGQLLWRILHEGDIPEDQLAEYMASEYPGYEPDPSNTSLEPSAPNLEK